MVRGLVQQVPINAVLQMPHITGDGPGNICERFRHGQIVGYDFRPIWHEMDGINQRREGFNIGLTIG